MHFYRNDKFADVLLFTSQMDGGCGIPAHKIILSSCSHVGFLFTDHIFLTHFVNSLATYMNLIFLLVPVFCTSF